MLPAERRIRPQQALTDSKCLFEAEAERRKRVRLTVAITRRSRQAGAFRKPIRRCVHIGNPAVEVSRFVRFEFSRTMNATVDQLYDETEFECKKLTSESQFKYKALHFSLT